MLITLFINKSGIEIAGNTSKDFLLMSQVSVCISRKSIISKCYISIVIETAQALVHSWLTAIAVSFITFIYGNTHQDAHLIHLIAEPFDLICQRYVQIHQPNFEICAIFSKEW